MSTYHLDRRFKSHVDRTDRVLEIAEAFGLGLDDKEFVIFDNQPIRVDQGDVVYITGQSGSGKSLALRELKIQMATEGLAIADIDEVPLDATKPLIDQIGSDTSTALNLLSIAGLNDAYLFVRKPQELSDGQRYRFKLAKLIESGAKVWIADEFLAVLDRTTAKVLAFNLQKTARKMGATLMVATTHTDMVADLAPNVFIEKRYREKIEIVQDSDEPQKEAPQAKPADFSVWKLGGVTVVPTLMTMLPTNMKALVAPKKRSAKSKRKGGEGVKEASKDDYR